MGTPDLTPLEAAEILEFQANHCPCMNTQEAFQQAASYLRAIAAGKLIELLDIPLNKTLYWLWGNEIMPVRYKGINGGFVGKDKKFHVTYRMATKKERSFPYTWHRKRGINTIPAGNERFFCEGDMGKSIFVARKDAEAAKCALMDGKDDSHDPA